MRLTRRALDLIEDEVGRPINFHSYVSGVAGPEIAVMFAEEGVNGAHQDPQYNVLYRNINMYRSFVDAAVAKHIMAAAEILQIDGAHNANATAIKAWKVMPELLVQHAINCAFSVAVGMPKEDIALSTVPPDAAPAPCMRMDLPYAIALRDLFGEYKMRAQQNTRYMESDGREATVAHVMNLLISRLTSADIQSTITPDEGRNVPWHYNNVAAVDTAKQSLVGHGRPARDGRGRPREPRAEGARARAQGARGALPRGDAARRRLLRRRRAGVLRGLGRVPGDERRRHRSLLRRRRGRGLDRDACGRLPRAGVPPLRREPPRAARGVHRGQVAARGNGSPCEVIGGCTLCDDAKVPYIDELDPEDNANVRLAETADLRERGLIKPEVEWAGDGVVVVTMFLPAAEAVAEAAALELGRAMNLTECEVIHKRVMHPAEGTLVELKGRLDVGDRPRDARHPRAARRCSPTRRSATSFTSAT